MSLTLGSVTEEMRASLLQRFGALEQLWQLLTRDLTLQHVNHFERPGVLPIAFTLLHAIGGQDRSRAALFGGGVMWDAHARQVGYTGQHPGRGTPMSVAEQIRIKDVDAWRLYQRDVFAATRSVLTRAPLSELAAPHSMSREAFEGGFLALLVGTRENVRVIDAVEAWIYQHGIRHAGELEHARALVGLGGVA
jgi:hypothetical protein